MKLFPITHNPPSHYSKVLIGLLIVYCVTADSRQRTDYGLLAQNRKEKKNGNFLRMVLCSCTVWCLSLSGSGPP